MLPELESFSFGDSPELADELLELVDCDAFVALARRPTGRGLLADEHGFEQFIREIGTVAEREAFQLWQHSPLHHCRCCRSASAHLRLETLEKRFASIGCVRLVFKATVGPQGFAW